MTAMAFKTVGDHGRLLYNIHGGCAGSVQVGQQGESPCPTKHSEQSVLSLGAEAARLGLSVGRGVREPQWETVKRYSLVRHKERKPR